MATPSYDINYEDERFTQVEAEKGTALNNITNTYNNMINQSDQFYQDQQAAVQDYANTQKEIQQANTDFAIQQIEQQKEQAGKDYTKEQKGAYVDWQKQSNQYGANAEQMAASGLTNTGFSESSQVSMYNQYQTRTATARESYNQAVLNYDNKMTEARLANSSALAEIAYNALQAQLELSLEGFQYKNSLISEQIQMQQQTEDRYYSRWQDVLNQMNQENQFAESIRQYEQNYKFQVQQFEEEKAQFEKSYQLQIQQINENIRQFDAEMERLKKKDAEEYALQIQQLELQKQQAQKEAEQWEKEYQLKQQQFAQEQANWEKEYALAKKSSSSSGSTGGYTYTDTKNGSAEVKTQYYSGKINPDVQYGTFNTTDVNGVKYQPNNVGGKKLSKTGLTIDNNGVNQNVWKSTDGKYYYWEGKQNKYIQISSGKVKALETLSKYSSSSGSRR